MSDWISQYSLALDVRDAREKAHKPYIDAYTKLADRSALAASKPSSSETALPDRTSTPSKGTTKAPNPEDLLPSLRADLQATQRARSTVQARLDEVTLSLSQLQTQNKSSTSQLTLLTRQKADVERRLRDREEEIREKGRLVTDAQDEMVSLQLQLNMAEQRSEKLEQENKELVDRWMKRMGEEAEKVNRDSRWE